VSETAVMDGLGTQPATPIVALPPIEKLQPTLRLDPATAEPYRARTVQVAYAALLLAAAAQAAGLGLMWWRAIHMDTFPAAARLIQWTHPNPGSPASLAVAVAVVAIGVVLVAAPALAGYLGWVGRPQAPWWAVGALAATAVTLAITPNTWAVTWANIGWLAVPLTLVGVVTLWLPASRRGLRDWQAFRQPVKPAPGTGPVAYGRLEQFR